MIGSGPAVSWLLCAPFCLLTLSRPELPPQLASIGEWEIASELDALLSTRLGVSGVEER
jgi:hypothetical protein